jgi:Tol biopolymer transport system component/DNA-binding winged helix-turn-helix (wHTH) protein
MAEYRRVTEDPLRFGVFEMDPAARELRKHGVRIKLQDQPFAVLLILLEKPGQLVTREELQQRLWPADTFVEFDKGIYNAMKRLRETLGDDAETPRYIETIPKRGYRFLAEVHKTSPAGLYSSSADTKPTSATVGTGRQYWPTKRARISVGVALLALICGMGIWRLSRVKSRDPLPPIEVVPLAGLGRFEWEAAFSPDGNHVAYADHSPSREGIYVTTVGSEKSLRLTSDFFDCCPRWSPDGGQVAFSRLTDGAADIFVVPASGGTEHRISEWPTKGHQISTIPKYRAAVRCFDWSPDGKSLALTSTQENKTHSWIALLSLEDSTARSLTSPESPEVDYAPSFSPDGSTVAFIRGTAAGVAEDLYLVPAAGGSPKRLTFDNAPIGSPASWTADGHDLIFSSTRSSSMSLWRMSARGGSPQPLPGVGEGSFIPSVSLKGHQLIYQRLPADKVSIWRVDLSDDRRDQSQRELVPFSGTRPHFSPDGKKFVFESDRLGYSEIWACDSEGSNCGKLTALKGAAGAARWSPDGRHIAFEYRPKEHTEVYLLDMSSGLARLITTLPGADNGGPNWSRDGEWIYFYSDRGGSFQIWKTRISGGTPQQVTKNGGVFAAESVDGQFLYFSKYEVPGVWKMPLNGGDEVRVLDQPAGDDWWNWSLTRDGIYFFDPPKGKSKPTKAAIKFLAFATSKTTVIAMVASVREGQLIEDTPVPSSGLAVSPNGKSILFTILVPGESRIMLMKNFR